MSEATTMDCSLSNKISSLSHGKGVREEALSRLGFLVWSTFWSTFYRFPIIRSKHAFLACSSSKSDYFNLLRQSEQN